MLHAANRKRFDPVAGKYSYGTGPINSFTTFNLYTSYALGARHSLKLGIENFFNEDYYTIPSQWQVDNLAYVKGNGARATVTYQFSF
jgi:iron complex outermembrane recepter protein